MTRLYLRTIIALCLALSSIPSSAEKSTSNAKTLDELLAKVISGKNAESEINQKRLDSFKKLHDKQKYLLSSAIEKTRQLEAQSGTLNKTIANNERELSALQEQLSKRLGNFGELFGVTRQVAGDTRSQIDSSLISAQFPGRSADLENIAKSKTLPTMKQLRKLWVVLLQEQIEQGKVSRFTSAVSDAKGIPQNSTVLRVGPFTAMSADGFLVYRSDTHQLSQLQRQPPAVYRKVAKKMTQAAEGELVEATIDPSRGVILGLLVQAPSLIERFHQGGLPGYVVTGLALIGLSIGILRLLSLWLTGVAVRRQMKNRSIDTKNPLGRILQTYEENTSADVETLELKLNDAILKEVPSLDRGLSTIKVLAAVAPLIGLLGTVIGMILTFQAITLWGTGEPKIMAGGISQALVTTVQGLVAAIPLLLIHSFTHSRARLIQQVLEQQSAGIIASRAELSHE